MEITTGHERRLKSLGKTKEWYQEKLAAQNGGCAACNQPETRIGLDGKPRPLVANVAGDCLLCLKCSMSQNKRHQRQRDSKYKELVAKKAGGPQTGDAFWTRERDKLTEEQRVSYEARDSETILLWDELKACLRAAEAGREFDEPALRDFVREVCESLLNNGTTFVDLVLIDFFRPEFKDTYEQYVTQGGATALFVQFGYITAIPSSDAYRFLEFAERHFGLPVSQFETPTIRIGRIYDFLDHGKIWLQSGQVIRCETRVCKQTKTLPPFQIPPAQWWCATCQVERDKAAHAALIRIGERQLTQQRNDSVYDYWGRFKDLERETIYYDAGRYDG